MNCTITDGEKYQKVLRVEVPAEQMELNYKLAAKRLAEKVNIPGFRKGKVPQQVLENHIGIEAILEEVANDVVNRTYFEAVQQTKIEPVEDPAIVMEQLEKGKALIYTATVTVRPEITLGEYKGLKAEMKIRKVEDSDVESYINMQRRRLGKMEEVEEGYAAQLFDTVTIDFAGYIGEAAFDGGQATDYKLELGSGTFIPGFEDQLVGAKVGDHVDVVVTFPENYQGEFLAGKEATFKCDVKAITHKVLPEIDTAFVEQISEEASTPEELYAEVRARFAADNEAHAKHHVVDELLQRVADDANLDLPPVMIEYAIDEMVRQFAQQISMQGVQLETYLQMQHLTMEQLREDYRERATKELRTELVLEEVVANEDIKVTREDLDARLQEIANAYWRPVEEITKAFTEGGQLPAVIAGISRDKAADFIFENAEITKIEVTAEEEHAAYHK